MGNKCAKKCKVWFRFLNQARQYAENHRNKKFTNANNSRSEIYCFVSLHELEASMRLVEFVEFTAVVTVAPEGKVLPVIMTPSE